MASPAAKSALVRSERAQALNSFVVPWLAPLATWVTEDLALRLYFRQTFVLGRENLPLEGPLLFAPTHRARWDALMLPMAAGRRVSGRDCRFMVTTTEMQGLQGWFLRRLGCFAIDQERPGTASLRFAIDLLAAGQQVVVFPEGRINREREPIKVEPGLTRLASLARSRGISPLPVVPVGLAYSRAKPACGDRAAICFGQPLHLEGIGKAASANLAERLLPAMRSAEEAARSCLGLTQAAN
jgi:1-acyl-sn-glycerol-3-phosphate acyltransferase